MMELVTSVASSRRTSFPCCLQRSRAHRATSWNTSPNHHGSLGILQAHLLLKVAYPEWTLRGQDGCAQIPSVPSKLLRRCKSVFDLHWSLSGRQSSRWSED